MFRPKRIVRRSRKCFNGNRRRRAYYRSLVFDSLEPRQLLATTAVYSDSLEAGWLNYSWSTTVDFAHSDVVHSGSNAIAATHNGAWVGLYLATESPVNVSPSDEFRFHVNGGIGGQLIRVSIVDGSGSFLFAETLVLPANQWQEVVIDLNGVGSPSQVSGIAFQDGSGSAQATFYVDSVEIGDFSSEPITDPVDGPAITIDATQELREIDDAIYGLNFADPSFAAEIGLGVNRWGGNSTSRYNYQIDASNRASDFFFENIPSGPGESSDDFITANQSTGADTIMTIGMLDFVANSADFQGSYSVAKYGDQQEVNMYRPDHGNGILLDGTRIVNDPLDTSLPVDETFANAWIDDIVSKYGTADQGGVKYYALGNEPMLWNSTHVDVHPDGASYDEVLEKGIRYAEAIKEADASANVLGPVVWGWTAYFYSGLDAAPGGAWYLNPQDRNAHDGMAFLPWYLEQMEEYESENGQRLLDYLDIHYYPQNEGVALTKGGGDAETQAARLESTRSLWDATYVDESWINDTVQLIPRMRNWIDTHYPGTKLALTEYNFGGVEHISGALAQADALGIFGREGVDLATMWAPPENDDPVAYAFRMYRNYDGSGNDGSRFGETGLSASTEDAEQVSVFASHRESDNSITVMLINKTGDQLTTPVSITGAADGLAEVYSYGQTDLSSIARLTDLEFANGVAEITLAANSITLLEIDGGAINGPRVEQVTFGDGTLQRSNVDSLTVQFDSQVSFSDQNPLTAFELSHENGNKVSLVLTDNQVLGGKTTLTFSFSGPFTRAGGSLIDGNYQLAINGSDFFLAGTSVFGQSDIIGDNDQQDDRFFAMFGDRNGDRKVNVDDVLGLVSTLGLTSDDDGFDRLFDYNNDGIIDVFNDAIAFVARLGTEV